ncbi:MAG: hypothetical protein WDZ83_19115 [Rhizobiaceae bacterium]
MRGQKVLAIAAGTGRVAYVFFVGQRLHYWQLSYAASHSPTDAARYAKAWIEQMRPDVVVTEKVTMRSRKGRQAKMNLEAIVRVAERELLFDIQVERPHRFPNKYTEAEAFAERFPELARWVPRKRRLWDPEPKNITIFEALALALEVIDPPPEPER